MIFPMILLYTNTQRLLGTLRKSRVLANGRWSEYNRFRPSNGINSLFYWTQALNFDRHGRNGVSPTLGTGQYYLGNFWFSSLTSLYLYWRLGAMLPLLSMFGWACSHALWLSQSEIGGTWVIVVVSVAIASSYFYGGAFIFLNYNAFGWLFMPLGLYGLITGNYWIAAFAWLWASLGSITVVFIAGWISLAWAVYQESLLPLLALFLATFKLCTHLAYVPDFKNSIQRVVSAVGLNNLNNSGVKYKRSKRRELLSIPSIYFVVTWGLFIGILINLNAKSSALLVTTVYFLWIVNSSIARFADEQSMYMAMFSVATASLIVTPSWLLLCAYWLGISPPPFLLGAGSTDGTLLKPKSYAPFRVQGLIDRCHEFLSFAPRNARVILALNDPNEEYSRLFDGNRVLHELVFHVGNLREILVFPDWWAVFENNTSTSSGFWGRTPEAVLGNTNLWNADHVLVYQDTATSLDGQWTKAGFVELSSMDWGELILTHLDGEPCWGSDKTAPKWFLLKAPKPA